MQNYFCTVVTSGVTSAAEFNTAFALITNTGGARLGLLPSAHGVLIRPIALGVQTIPAAVQMADAQQHGGRSGQHHEDLSEISHDGPS